MRFELSEDQELLRVTTADMLAAESPIAVSRQISESNDEGFSREHWKKLAELGYLGLLIPEADGGQGLGAVEFGLVCAELGKVCFPGPYMETVVAAKVLELAGGQDALLTKIAAGEAVVVTATADGCWPTDEAKVTARGDAVVGTKFFVPFGACADALVVSTEGGVYLVDAPYDTTAMPTFDDAARFASVDLDHAGKRLGDAGLLDGVADLTAVGAAAQALGVCERTMSLAVEYAKQRETFGKPIGVYQVLQHRMADMLLRTESARSIVMRAAWCLATGAPDAALVAASAKQYAVEAANQITREAVQIHGGNGFTWEYDLHFYLKRALTLSQHYGRDDELLERALEAFSGAAA